jgi:Concanavalin A-like lectin/glucanases superfamily
MSYYSSTVLADSPQGCWRMDDPFGNVAKDQTVNAYNGSIQGGVTLGQAGALSLDADTAMLFDGSTGDILLPSSLSTNGWGAISIEAWINLSNITFAYTANIMANDSPNTSHVGFQFGVNNNNVLFRIGTGSSSNTLTVNKTFVANTWYRICATFTGTVMTVYIRDLAGNLTTGTSTIASQTIPATTNQLMIGAKPGATPNNFPGLLDEVGLYNYALTSGQDVAHFTAGTISTYPYLYGPFQIANHSGGLGYFLVAKDLDLPVYKPTLSPVARQDMWKVNGWQVDPRNIQVDIIVVGTSRADCEARKDTLEQALSLRDQQLSLHSLDGRYWIANATAGKAPFKAGAGIVQVRIPVTFMCADPYAKAVAAATPFDSGSLAYTASGSSYISPIFTVAGGGTVYAWPQIHLVNKTASLGSTTLTTALVQGQSYNAIFVSNTSFSGTVGQVLTLYFLNGSQLWTQKVTVSAAYATNAVQINVNAFTAAFNFPNTTTVYVSTAWNQVTVSQLTDNYTLSLTSTSAAPLPQTLGDYLDIYTDPSNGMYIVTNGLAQYLDFTGAFPPLEAGNTQWQVQISADSAPTVDFAMAWTPRWLS